MSSFDARNPYAPQDEPPFGQPPRKSGMPVWAWVLIVIGGLFALLTITCCAGLMWFGSVAPDTSIYPGNLVPQGYLDELRSVGGLDPGESVRYFYSDAVLDVKQGMYALTDDDVVIYVEAASPSLTVVPFSEIADLSLYRDTSFFTDSQVTLELKDGRVVSFPLSSEYDRDQAFFRCDAGGSGAAVSDPAADASPVRATNSADGLSSGASGTSGGGPGAWWYAVAAVLLVGSLVPFVWMVSHTRSVYQQQVAGFERFVAPGAEAVELQAGERYTIYYENRGTLGAQAFDTDIRPMPAMNCAIISPAGEPVTVTQAEMVTVYDLPEREGHAMWTFDTGEAGRYRIEVTPVPANPQDLRVLLAVGQLDAASTSNSWAGLWGASAVAAIVGLFAVVMALVVLMLRSGSVTQRDEPTT